MRIRPAWTGVLALAAGALSGAGLLAGCSPGSDSSVGESEEMRWHDFAKVREEYVEAARQRLNQLQLDASALAQTISPPPPSDVPARREGEIQAAQAELDRLEAQVGRIRGELDVLESATADDWSRLQKEFETALSSAENRLQDVRERFLA